MAFKHSSKLSLQAQLQAEHLASARTYVRTNEELLTLICRPTFVNARRGAE